MLQKSSKHFLISIFFPPFSFRTPPPPAPFQKKIIPICLQLCSYKCVLSIFIYNIALQNTDFGVLQKSSKHFLISIFFYLGKGGHPLPVPPPLGTSCLIQGFRKNVPPPPARYFVPRTMSTYLFYNFVVQNVCCQYLYTI